MSAETLTIRTNELTEGLKHGSLDRMTIVMVLCLFILQFMFPHVVFQEISEGIHSSIASLSALSYELNPALERVLKQSLVPTVLAAEAGFRTVAEPEYKESVEEAVYVYGALPVVSEKDEARMELSEDAETLSEITLEPGAVLNVRVTGYNSEIDQTDDTPCITANGFNICEADKSAQYIIANNCLGFGTKVSFPELNPRRIYIVKDRMNSRYDCNTVDIWMREKSAAIEFGLKKLEMAVYAKKD